MKREHRYFVLKLTDADRWLTATERLILAAIGEKVEAHRCNTGKAPLECVVVERDWPEYEPTWKAIEARVDAQPNAPAQAPAKAAHDAGN